MFVCCAPNVVSPLRGLGRGPRRAAECKQMQNGNWSRTALTSSGYAMVIGGSWSGLAVRKQVCGGENARNGWEAAVM